MPSPLDTYLHQIAAHLTPLPVKRRAEELREIRQHLLNAVTINKELGQSAEDAAANAVIQFGDPADLGGNLVWTWRRETKLNRRSLWGAALCSLAVLLFAPGLSYSLVLPHLNPLGLEHFTIGEWLLWLVGVRLAGPLIAVAVTGFVFCKRAPLGGVLGPVLYFILCIPASFHQIGNILTYCLQDVSVILCMSWIISRVRLQRSRQVVRL